MATSFPSAPSPYSISPQAYIALSQLNLQNPGQASGTPVSSVGLTQGTPAVSTQQALQQALSNALSSPSLASQIQNWTQNPSAAASYAGSTSAAYTPNQPSNAWRLNTNTGAMSPLFAGGTVNQLVAPNSPPVATAPTQNPLAAIFDQSSGSNFQNYAGGAF